MENIKLSTNNNKSYKKLGFTYLETAELVINLKRLLANYQVHYHSLRNLHWKVEGSEFLLVEKMAAEIANICLEEPRVERARVSVEKPGALRFARSVGVTIERGRDDV
jgi:dihydroneopterin aldolase